MPAPSISGSGKSRSDSGSGGMFTHSFVARVSFSLCFSESCTLFLLFMCQETGLLDSRCVVLSSGHRVCNSTSRRGRYMNWQISLALLLLVILVSIPLSQNILLTYHSPLGLSSFLPSLTSKKLRICFILLGRLSRTRSMPTRISMALVPYAFYLFLLAMIPLPESLGSKSIVSAALSRLIVLGTFIIGMLSGIGAARYIWAYIPAVRARRWVKRHLY